MLEATIGVFRAVGTILFWVVVGTWALLGLGIGHLFDLNSQSGMGGFLGLIVGGAAGFVVASCTFGVVHLLISINDNSARLVALQERTVKLLEHGSPKGHEATPAATAPASTMSPSRERVAATEADDELRRRLYFLPIGSSLEFNGKTIWKRDGLSGSYFETDGFSGSLNALLESLKQT
jgi:hypothetical protein